ncbi:MAG TPA: DUF1501 domain-containing protein [Terriglobales bacterium]|jgi:Protein of unknown function (DUF1501)|nr:DUF1501 domain-containing protein [Terriglobales bacterium]
MADKNNPYRGLRAEQTFAQLQSQTRRHFLQTLGGGLGSMFLGSMVSFQPATAANVERDIDGEPRLDFRRDPRSPLSALPPQFAARAKRVIYLHMAGAPSQLELFEYKPELVKLDGQDCPQSLLAGKRFAFITGVPKLMGPQYPFHQTGESGHWISDRLPHLEKHLDELCFIKSMRTDQFNHAPAQLLVQTGNARLGYPSLGSWVVYGLGTENQNLPGFIVLISGGNIPDGGKQLWGTGFLPSVYQGVQCRSHGEPVLYLKSPKGVSVSERRNVLNAIDELNQQHYAEFGNPETVTRIAQYEMSFRMQMDATDAMDIHKEPEAVRARYGSKVGEGSFANNCLVARRLAERGVRFIQLYHWGWDSHGSNAGDSLNFGFVKRCAEVDQPIAALLSDLKERGMLDDTLIVWGGEFGRTSMRENRSGQVTKFTGRDHHPGAFTIWMAGGGVKPGMTHGQTDDLGYEIVKDPVEVRDLHATMLYLLGFDHRRLNYSFQGLDQKLTSVKPARVVAEVVA